MFYPGSRYINLLTYQVTMPDGTVVTAMRLPLPNPQPLLGYYPRKKNQRLDQIAAHFLADAAVFWQLCDSNGSVVPDGLAAQSQIGIPKKS
jgi:hypothetical protein